MSSPTGFFDAEGFPLVGESCSFELCRDRDFLPFACRHCSKKFCLRHAAPVEHECKVWDPVAEAENDGARALVCPICEKAVRYQNGPGAAEAAWAAHEAICAGRAEEVPRCPALRCTKTLTASGSVICGTCRKRVCLKHRYEDMHPCREQAMVMRFSALGVGAPNPGAMGVAAQQQQQQPESTSSRRRKKKENKDEAAQPAQNGTDTKPTGTANEHHTKNGTEPQKAAEAKKAAEANNAAEAKIPAEQDGSTPEAPVDAATRQAALEALRKKQAQKGKTSASDAAKCALAESKKKGDQKKKKDKSMYDR
mmetsp:Transcript_55609/g.154956  ORF Transcript_55609/g.154956 Transcript_55609/m.154956 type:complete len:309 (-) Transcript_55609:201-1127(-)